MFVIFLFQNSCHQVFEDDFLAALLSHPMRGFGEEGKHKVETLPSCTIVQCAHGHVLERGAMRGASFLKFHSTTACGWWWWWWCFELTTDERNLRLLADRSFTNSIANNEIEE